jgi:flagellar hook-associated protein 2
MSGTYSVSGLISGLNSSTLIRQLMAIEKQPITRVQTQVTEFQSEKSAIQSLRTTLLTLTNAVKDFALKDIFGQYAASSSDTDVTEAQITGSNPVKGAYTVNVTQLASATIAKSSATLGGAIDPDATLDSSGLSTELTEGTFSINGVTFTLDPTTQSLNDVIGEINSSSAGVTATYDSGTDTITFTNSAVGDTNMINFSTADEEGESNFLEALNVTGATQLSNLEGTTYVTSTRNLGALDTSNALEDMNFANGDVTAGTIMINGVSITIDPTTDTIGDVLQRINDSDAKVTASYDASTDTIQVVSNTLGSRTISFSSGTSNFLELANLTTATQTAGTNAKFTVNGGAEQTRNTNEVTDAISGVTLSFLSTGTSTVTVKTDNEGITDAVNTFISAFNEGITEINSVTATDGDLAGQGDIKEIASYLRSNIFSLVSGSGTYSNLTELGITTGSTFDSSAVQQLQLDGDTFTEALSTSRSSVASLFNNSDGTGIMDVLTDYLNEVTGTSGFLNNRSKSNGTIDQQITDLTDRIDAMTHRADQKEQQLKNKYAKLETALATLQAQSSALSSWTSSL